MKTTDALPLILAKALGEALHHKVGPTLIVGNVARIDVPTEAVAQRALKKETFLCLGQRLTILKNENRIIG